MKATLMLILVTIQTACGGIWVTPGYVGNGAGDSVVVSFCTFDTTFYPTIKNADSVVALRYGPNNSLVDSLTQSSARLFNIRIGWYEIHYRGSDASGNQGNYRVYVRVKMGGAWRGAATANYRVIDDEVGNYFLKISADGDSVKDTLGLVLHLPDTAKIARSVWDDDIVNRKGRRIGWVDTVDVTNNVPTSGTGAFACTLAVREGGSGGTLQGVFLRVMNSAETQTQAVGATNSNGRVIFSLDAATYHVYPYLAGYTFANLPETIVVTSGGANDTISGSLILPGSPQSASLCRVYGYVQSLGAAGLEDVVVSARVSTTPLLHNGVVISPYTVSTATDSSGYWFLDLIPNGDLDPSNTKYEFTIYYPSGTVLRKQLAVPDSGSCWFRW